MMVLGAKTYHQQSKKEKQRKRDETELRLELINYSFELLKLETEKHSCTMVDL